MSKLSVCIPVYNGEAYIGETIGRVLKQTYQDFELIVVDNASTDSTVRIVEAIQDKRIHLFVNERNVGMAGNWNRCLEKVDTEYIQILCADDIIGENCLEEKMHYLEQNKDIALVFSASNVCDWKGKKIMGRRPFRGNRKFLGKKIIKKSFRKKNLYGEPSNVMFRKSAAKKAGEFDPLMGYNLDWEYWLRLSQHGNIGYIDKELSFFRISAQSSTSNYLMKNRKVILKNDRQFVEKCKKNREKGLSGTDIFIHVVAGRIQLYLKILFLIFAQISARKGE